MDGERDGVIVRTLTAADAPPLVGIRRLCTEVAWGGFVPAPRLVLELPLGDSWTAKEST